MQSARTVTALLTGILVAWLSIPLAARGGGGADRRAVTRELSGRIVALEDSPSGLAVLLGAGDGRLAVALQARGYSLVHALDTSEQRVAAAREHIEACGLYGRVAVDAFAGQRLPYADNLVNLLVVRQAFALKTEELLRILRPGGRVVLVTEEGAGQITETRTKPWPDDTDEWTHFLHDPSGNAVAHDERVGPPRRIQWVAGPSYARSHEHTPSINAVVSAQGRIFYIADQASIGAIRDTPRWQLVARDAFNGVELWTQAIPSWFPHIVNWGQTPKQLQRKLVAVQDRVYVTLGLHAPLSVLDAATGRLLGTYENTHGTEEVLCHEGILLLAIRGVTDERISELAKWSDLALQEDSPIFERDAAEPLVRRLRAIERQSSPEIVALNAATGEVLWKRIGSDAAGLKTLSLCAHESRVFYQAGATVHCVDLNSGENLWSVAAPTLRTVSEERVFCAGNERLVALSPESGQRLWEERLSVVDVRDVFVANGSLWIGGFKPFPAKRGPAWGPYFVTQRDLQTGQQKMHIEPPNPEHHHRCYQNKATDRFILGGRRGTEFIDLESGDVQWNSFARGVCKYGVMPCNGLLYVPPHACACYVQTKLIGFHALAAAEASRGRQAPSGDSPQLVLGPAYGSRSDEPVPPSQDREWPTYRHDGQRSGATTASLPPELRRLWQADLESRLTAPTVADGRVFVAATDQHSVVALRADSGEESWRYKTGGRVDSPPTLHAGHALFGSRDGRVYCLRSDDGTLAWRLLPCGFERWVVARGQLESVAPIHGSVLVQRGNAYVINGTSTYLDGGLGFYRIEPATGRVISHRQLYSPNPLTDKQPDQSAPYAMPGGRADILSGDGSCVYLRDSVYGPDGQQRSAGNPHLLTLTGFLDDAWAHRSYWIFGTRCSISTGCSGRDRNIVAGRLLVFDDTTVFGYGRSKVDWSNQLQDGPYRLYAASRGDGRTRWTSRLGIQVRAMALAGNILFLAGPEAGPALRGDNADAKLLAVAATDGSLLAQYALASPPVFDGMAIAANRLYLALDSGSLVCFAGS